MKKTLTAGSLLALTAVLSASLAAQRVWVVAPTAGQGVDSTVIQDAVDAAANGDMVLVRQGTYARLRHRRLRAGLAHRDAIGRQPLLSLVSSRS